MDEPDREKIRAALLDGWELETSPDPCGKTDYYIISPDGVLRARSSHSAHAYRALVSQWEIWKSLGKPGKENPCTAQT